MLFNFEISSEAYDLLIKIKNSPISMELKDGDQPLELFIKDRIESGQTIEELTDLYYRRNFKHNPSDLEELFRNHLIDYDGEAYHLTVILTDFAKKLLK